MTDFSPETRAQVTLCEVLDRLLNKGAVISGEVIISVADVDLIYLNLKAMIASVETARGQGAVVRTGVGTGTGW